MANSKVDEAHAPRKANEKLIREARGAKISRATLVPWAATYYLRVSVSYIYQHIFWRVK